MADADKTTTLNHFYEKLLKIKVRPALEPWHFTLQQGLGYGACSVWGTAHLLCKTSAGRCCP